MSEKIESFVELITSIKEFVEVREWNKFHTPRNVALALAGECGELSEIFQWKEDTFLQQQNPSNSSTNTSNSTSNPSNNTSIELISKDIIESFSFEERVHLGEEISDVFIYTTRLANLCNLDIIQILNFILSQMKQQKQQQEKQQQQQDKQQQEEKEKQEKDEQERDKPEINFRHPILNDLSFHDLIVQVINSFYSPTQSSRDINFSINFSQGIISSLFGKYGATNSLIDNWSENDIYNLSISIGHIIMLLITLTLKGNLNLSYIIANKIKKNNQKYPAHLVRGSSKKYTFYINKFLPSFIFTNKRILLMSFLCFGSLFFIARSMVNEFISERTVAV